MSTEKTKLLKVPVIAKDDILWKAKDEEDEKKLTRVGFNMLEIANLKNMLKKMFKDKDIDASNILEVVKQGMIIVAGSIHLSGKEKKQLLIKSISLLIDELPIDENARDIIIFVFEMSAPSVIDDLIAAAKGDFKFKETKKNICCFC